MCGADGSADQAEQAFWTMVVRIVGRMIFMKD